MRVRRIRDRELKGWHMSGQTDRAIIRMRVRRIINRQNIVLN
jgi:hypothetical protein